MHKLLKNVIGVAAIGCLMSSVNAYAAVGIKFNANLSGAQEVAVSGPGLIGSAQINVVFESDLSAVSVKLTINGGGNVVAAHFHCARAGANGPVAVTLFSGGVGPLMFDGLRASGTLTNADVSVNSCVTVIGQPVNNIASLAFAMRLGLIYVNVHTTDNFGGEVRGQMLE